MVLFGLGVVVGGLGVYLAGHGSVWRSAMAAFGGEAPPGREVEASVPGAERRSGASHRRGPAPGSRRPRSSGRLAGPSDASGTAAGDGGAAHSGDAAAAKRDAGADQGAVARTGAAAAVALQGGAAGAPAGPARIALVIDDLGRSLGELDDLHRLGVPITYAVLPFESQTAEVAAALRRRHDEILCHLPMEPRSGGNPGPGALRAGMSPEQLRQSTLAAIAAVPGAVGVNNHMGSALSADAGSMSTILSVLAARGLYFLDSRTSAQSVGFRVATALGVPAAERQVFLDDDPRPEAVAAEFQHLLEMARTRGGAIAIGHPHPATLATLAIEVPRAQALGYRFVQVSALLDRPPAAPPPSGR
jgi:polysaccharide deacetylase 2 family uncharacterized protein YibQ